MKCDKHNCAFIFKELEHGKSIQVCPECDKERYLRAKEMFRGVGIKSTCPFCKQEMPTIF